MKELFFRLLGVIVLSIATFGASAAIRPATHAVHAAANQPVVATVYTGVNPAPYSTTGSRNGLYATGPRPQIFGTNASIVIWQCTPNAIYTGQSSSCTIHFDGDGWCGFPTLTIYWQDGWSTTINFITPTCSYTGTFGHTYSVAGYMYVDAYQSSTRNSSWSSTVLVHVYPH